MIWAFAVIAYVFGLLVAVLDEGWPFHEAVVWPILVAKKALFAIFTSGGGPKKDA